MDIIEQKIGDVVGNPSKETSQYGKQYRTIKIFSLDGQLYNINYQSMRIDHNPVLGLDTQVGTLLPGDRVVIRYVKNGEFLWWQVHQYDRLDTSIPEEMHLLADTLPGGDEAIARFKSYSIDISIDIEEIANYLNNFEIVLKEVNKRFQYQKYVIDDAGDYVLDEDGNPIAANETLSENLRIQLVNNILRKYM